MKATCPMCGNYGPVENFLAQEDYKKALAVITGMKGDLPRLAVRYLGLFRKPGSDRALTGPRVLKVVSELKELAESKEIQWKGGRVYENRAAYWAEALQVVLDRADAGKLDRPLDGHGYLRSVAYGLAEKAFEVSFRRKEEQAGQRTKDAEQKKEIEETAEVLTERNKQKLAGLIEKLKGGSHASSSTK
jgi:hypothetical protein